jgi:sulfur carrier protein
MTTTVTVHINGQAFVLPAPATLADAVASMGLKPPFAAAVNLQFVPNSQYQHTELHDADKLDLIAPVTGA